MKSGKSAALLLVALILFIGMIASCAGCSGNDDYDDTLNSGLEKYYSGDSMTKKEYNAVKNFNKWRSEQGEKRYNDWE